MHLKEVLLFRLRSDEWVDVGWPLRSSDETGLRMATQAHNILKLFRHVVWRREECQFIDSDTDVGEDLRAERFLYA